ncbi:carbohydrate-binding module family 1 protein/Glycoside hydrolase family 5 protein [Serpula lacrymans var. lacrymans S7.3]|uniref:cellulase n=2 Tax=Serpula lacrymans var. lacrymans TaxID=341189 RepID=F8PJ86_SERL3|nr:glycoside hydrolase family 5 protein [Serpula lacrymans var. lacrymans S7.9]EGO03450.1 carbohydrate-binding module family 1 protein/Glycoside hydrolase family 5 protein [Serpula lacrymans var. lacrymans S7.3]EGO29211.1 glycoside hydrolase family 5 protein [Serpula lacrymans var. lacrymans S7.9]
MALKSLYALGLVGLTALSVRGQAAIYAQCGGEGFTGDTTCVSGAVCTEVNSYYYQCLAASATTVATGTATTTSAGATATSTCGATPAASAGTLSYAGVNIAGFDFGCDTDGDCTASGAYPPLTQYYGADGVGQMTHFVNDDNYNIFRLPVGWQFLTNNVLTGTLNQTNFAEYDTLVQACLATGASCIIDIHNYARWNGEIIGQGGPSNEIFASLWSSLATYYATESKVVFGVMNEPHDLPNITLWAGTVQAAVTAIREAGATTQLILLPGDDYTSAETFVSNGSADALNEVTNPDGSITGLVMDVHKYLDSDNSGTNAECVTNNIADAWEPLSQWLRCNGRQALNTETGGGNVASCETYMCEQIAYQAENSDVILGYVGWAAGNFATTYVLSETPTESGTTWTDTTLVSTCMAPTANGVVA